ncbi:MAG: MarR family winged helix-turn-helix transcriptional regulator [Dehalococcoidia bacterium]|nr:MarR family winged helix-turn-helix transcriptional regulator [Dehalococcoidia bacterium]
MSGVRPPDALLASDAFLVSRVRIRLYRRVAEGCAQRGLRVGHGPMLTCLAEYGPMTQRDLAQALGMDSGDSVRFLDDLEQAGLIERRADPHDRRRNVITITPAGLRMRDDLAQMTQAVEDEVFGVLTPSERAVLHDLLLRLAAPEIGLAATDSVALTAAGAGRAEKETP